LFKVFSAFSRPAPSVITSAKNLQQDYIPSLVIPPGGVGTSSFKGMLVEEFPPINENVRSGRIYLKLFPLIGIANIAFLFGVWWMIGIPMDIGPFWTTAIFLIIAEPVSYLFIQKMMLAKLYPISFFTNGIEFKISMLDKMRKVPPFIERPMIESVFLKEYEYVMEGRYYHKVNVDVKLRNGKKVNLGMPKFEVGVRIKEIVEKDYNLPVIWDKNRIHPRQEKIVAAARPKVVESSFCIHCGTKIDMGHDFCTSCGRKRS
jgi:hypothetical protein